MALIKCPECGKEISDKAIMCINCGYPLNSLENKTDEYICCIHGTNYNLKEEFELILLQDDYTKTVLKLASKCNINIQDAFALSKIMKSERKIPKSYECKFITNKSQCPMCKSTNIKKISTTSRMVSVVTVGLASGKLGKQYKCERCKYMW